MVDSNDRERVSEAKDELNRMLSEDELRDAALLVLANKQVTRGLSNHNRPYAGYDVTEGRPRVLGVKRGTATCAIAKHAASGPTPACHTAGLARARALTKRLSRQCALPAQLRARSATSLDPQHGVIVMET